MTLIRLDDSHRETVHRMRRDAEAWLRGKGLEQWNGTRAGRAHADLDAELDAGQMVGWLDAGGELVAVASSKGPDPDFWTVTEAGDDSAAYIGRFMVASHGRGHGAALLNAVIEQARRDGKRLMRLDCWRDNTALQDYYRAHGFELVRVMDVPNRMSGALFQRAI